MKTTRNTSSGKRIFGAPSGIVLFVMILFSVLGGQKAFSQGVGISEVSIVPNSSSILELRSSLRGFLAPRMTTVERLAIASPAQGLLVYDTTTQSFWYFESGWKAIASGALGTSNQLLGMNAPGLANEYKTLSGTPNQINILFTPGLITLSTPQNIDLAASPTFAGLTLSGLTPSAGVYTDGSSKLTSSPPTIGIIGYWNRTGSILSPTNPGDAVTTTGNIYTTAGGAITSSGLLTGSSGASVTGGIINLNNSSNFATNINTGTSNGDVTIGNSLSSLYLKRFTTPGILHNDASGLITSSQVSLTGDVSNTLPVGNGGTGITNIALNNLIYGNGINPVLLLAPSGTTGAILTTTASGAPGWLTLNTLPATSGILQVPNGGTGYDNTYTNGQLLIGNTAGTLTRNPLTGTTNQINVTNGDGSITLSTPQNIHTGASPTFAGLTLSGLTPNAGVYTNGTSGLTSAPPTVGTIGYWDRTGTILSPTTIGDAVTTTGNIYTTAGGAITSSGLLTGSSGASITGGAINLNNSSNFATNINTGTSTGGVTIGNSANTITLPAFATAGLVHNSAAGVLSTALLSGIDITNGTIDLTTKVNGILPILNGGTNSGAALSGQSIMISNGIAIVQGGAGTTTTVLHGNATGAPSYSQIANADIADGTIDLLSKVVNVLPVFNGGTGQSSPLIPGGVLYGSTAAAAGVTATGSVGQMLRSTGAGAPIWSTPTYPNSATLGKIMLGDGTNWLETAASYPNSTTKNELLYSSGDNIIAGVPAFNDGVLVTSNAGIPQWVLRTGFTSSILTDGHIYVGNVADVATDVPMSGDATVINTGAVTVGRINGATVPVAGALVTGNVLQVNGINSTTYAPVNVGGGANFVSGLLPVGNGGTGVSTLTTHGVVIGNGTSPLNTTGTGISGQVLQSRGGALDPSYSTAIYPTTTIANQILFSSANDNITGLTTGNNGVLVTDAGGVPSISSILPDAVQYNITKLGTITNGTWNGALVDLSHGGTNTDLSGGTAVGDLLYGTATGFARLADVAAGNVLISGGAGTAPSWNKVGLTTHVSGVLQALNGGTGYDNTYTNGQLLIGNASGTLTRNPLTGTTNQINVANGDGTITLSTPQNIHTGASPTFAGLTLSGLTPNSVVYTDASRALTAIPPSTGIIGFWNRIGTSLSPTFPGDDVTTSGNISTTGTGTITSAGLLTGNAGATILGGAVNLNNTLAFPTNINTGTSTGDVTIGNTANSIYLPKFTSPGVIHNNASGLISSGQIITADITDANVTPVKIAPGANNQVLVTDGTGAVAWINKDAFGAIADQVSIEGLGTTASPFKVKDLGIVTSMLADGAVTTIKLADGSVTNPKLAANSVTTDKIQDGEVQTNDIANLNVTTGKLADNAVTTVKITDANVTPVKIAPGANNQVLVTDGTGAVAWINKDAFGAIADQVSIEGLGTTASPFKVKDLGIVTSMLADGAVTTIKLADGSVTNPKLAANSVTTDKIQDGEVQTNDIANLNVTTGKLADNAVTTVKITDANVTPVKIAPGLANQVLVTDGAGAVAWINKDAFGAIADQVSIEGLGTTASPFKVKDLGIVTSMLADGAVTTIKLADGSVTNPKLAANSITTDKIQDGEVQTNDIANLNVTTGKLADNAVTTVKITDANVTPVKIAPGANNQVLVTDGSGAVAWINKDAFGAIADQVSIEGLGTTASPFKVKDLGIVTSMLADGAVTTIKLADGSVTNPKLAANSITTDKIQDGEVQTNDIANLNVTTGKLADNAVTTVKITDANVTPVKIAPGLANQVLVTDGAGAVAWINKDAFGAIADQVSIEGLGTTASPFKVKDLGIVTSMLADGAVTTIKLADGSVTNPKLAANSITTDKIQDGEVQTNDIANLNVTTGKLADNAVTTVKITDANVTPVKIAPGLANQVLVTDGAGAVAWINKDAFGAIADQVSIEGLGTTASPFKVKDLGIVTSMLADGAVTTIKLADGSVTNPKLAANSVTTDKIQDGEVQTNDIANLNVTTGKLADNAVTTVKITDANVTPVKIAPGANNQVLVTDGTGAVAWINKDAFGAIADQVSIEGLGTTASPFKVKDLGIVTSMLADGAVTTIKLADGSVTNPKLAANSITTDKIQDGEVQTNDIANLNVTTGKLADNAVTTVKITDANVTPVKIAPGLANQVLVTDGAGAVAWINKDAFGAIADQVSIEGLGTTASPFKVKDLGIVTSMLADGAVTTIKLADGSVTNPKLAANSVTTDKIQDGEVQTNDIANLNVTTGKLADNAVTTVKITDANVTPVKIAPGLANQVLVTDGAGAVAWINKDAFGAIADQVSIEGLGTTASPFKVKDLGIVTSMLADGAVTTIKLADGSVTNPKLAANSITTDKIQDGEVQTNDIANLNVTTGKLADNAVTTVKITDANVTTSKIADANVTTSKIADANVTPVKIAPGANNQVLVTDGLGAVAWINKDAFGAIADQVSIEGLGTTASPFKVKDLGIVTSMLADGAVTTIKLADGSVTNPKLAANSITTDKIQDGEVQTNDIANLNVTTGKLADNAVTTVKITDANVTTSKIADANVTTSKIADANVTPVKIAPGANNQVLVTDGLGAVAWINKDAFGAIADQVSIEGLGTTASPFKVKDLGIVTSMLADGAVTTIKLADGSVTNPKLAANSITTDKIQDGEVQTNDIANLNVTTGKLADNAVTTVKITDANVTPVKIAPGLANQVLVTDGAGAVAWINKDAFGAIADQVSIEGLGTTASPFKVKDLGIVNSMLADGAVTTIKLADGSVTNPKLAANSITTDKIQDGEVQTNDIANLNVTTGKLADNAVTTVKITDANVTPVKIAPGLANQVLVTDGAGAVAWINKDAFGAIADQVSIEGLGTTASPFKVKDLGIVTSMLADGAVTTIKLADGSVTNPKLAANSITTDKIQDGEVQTNDIANLNVTTGKLADNAVTTVKITDANVTTSKIADANVTAAKLTAGAGTTGRVAIADALGAVTYGTVPAGSITGNNITSTDLTVTRGTGATLTAVTLDIAPNAVTTGKIADGTIVNADIDPAAAIAYSKLASLASGNILLGNATGVPTSTAVTGDVTISNTGVTAIGATKVTNAMLAGSIASSKLVGTDIATVGTITSGTWNGNVILGQYGGTGVNNTGKTITLGGNLTTAGAFTTTLTATNNTTLTLPVTGTLATLAGAEALTNKTYNGNTITTGTGILTIAAGKTLTASDNATVSGTNTGDQTLGGLGGVPTTRTVNGKSLAADITLLLASADFVNQGAVTSVLHGNAAGNPSWSQIVNADVDAAAGIAYTKLASLTSGNILLGNATNVPTSTAVTGDVTISNTGVTAIGAGKVTNAMLGGSIAASKLVGTDIVTVGTITAGTWNAGVIPGQYGGTGVNNTGKTITLGGNLTTSGAFTTTLTATNNTTVTLPVSGTLATLAGAEALTNKTYNGNTITTGTGILTIAAGKTLTASDNATVSGTNTGDQTLGGLGGVPTTRTVNGRSLAADITLLLASADFVNQGAVTSVLHGNAAGNPSWSQIVNADVDAAAGIAYTKLASLTSGNILLGNATNVPTSTPVTGDVTITNGGVTAIGGGKVTNSMLAGSIAASKLVGTDIATVGTITAGVWNAGAVTSSGAITGNSIVKSGGLATQFLKADGTVDANTYVTSAGTVTNFTGALAGDVSGTQGATVIGAGKVTNTMLGGSIAASKLVGTDIATVGTITAGVWNAGAVTSSGAITGNSIVKSGGLATQFLKADGTVDANSYLTANQSINFNPGAGDVTGSASGTTSLTPTLTITNKAVTLAKMADMATGSLIYRKSAGVGDPEVQTIATLKTDLGLTGTNSGDQTITLTGDVTGSGSGSFAATIANNAVTYGKMQVVGGTSRLLGSSSTTTAVQELTLGAGLTIAGNVINTSSGVFANPSTTIGLTATNGVATTAMRSDAAPALNQGIVPTWTGAHIWSALGTFNLGLNASGAAVNLNAGSNFATYINTGTSTGAVNIANGTTGGNAIAIGNNVGASSITEKVGTGDFNLDGAGSSDYNIGASTTTGSINIGGTAETGALNLGVSTGAEPVNIATGASGVKTVHIADGGTANIITIGSTNIGASTTINAGNDGVILYNGLTGGGSAPTGAMGTGANNGGIPATQAIIGTNLAGRITITTSSTAPAASANVTVITFSNSLSFPNGCFVQIQPGNAATAQLAGSAKPFIFSTSTTGFTMRATATPLAASTQYVWYYQVTGY